MRSAVVAAVVGLAACTSSGAEQRADAAPGKPVVAQAQTQAPLPPGAAPGMGVAPMSTGVMKVHGGESFSLRGPVMITVVRVMYLNQPCPPGVECIHSGVMRQVQFQVSRGEAQKLVTVAQGNPQVVDGVQLRVLDVQPGPVAEIEASLPVGAGPNP